jgi:hypothetical protein
MLHMLARHGGIVIIHMEQLIQELFVHLYIPISFQLLSLLEKIISPDSFPFGVKKPFNPRNSLQSAYGL